MRVRFVSTLAACVFTVAVLAGQRPPAGERVGTVFAPRLLDPPAARSGARPKIVAVSARRRMNRPRLIVACDA
jgi:hypothetical protein